MGKLNVTLDRVRVPKHVKDAVAMGDGYARAQYMAQALSDVETYIKRERDRCKRYLDDPANRMVVDGSSIDGRRIRITVPEGEDPAAYVERWLRYVRIRQLLESYEEALPTVARLRQNVENRATVEGMEDLGRDIRDSEGLLALSFQDVTGEDAD